jgi:hypothetical protein
MLNLWPALRSYFLSIEDSPKILKRFFESEESEIVAVFLQSILTVFKKPLMQLQRTNALLPEFIEIVTNFKKQIAERKEQHFFGALTRTMLNKLALTDQRKTEKLKKSFLVNNRFQFFLVH